MESKLHIVLATNRELFTMQYPGSTVRASRVGLESNDLILQPKNLPSRAVILAGDGYTVAEHNGRGNAVRMGSSIAAAVFTIDGSPYDRSSGVAIRLKSDPDLAFEVNYRKFESGTNISLWSITGHREYSCRFTLNGDGTISPLMNRDVVFGEGTRDKNIISLVPKHASNRIEFKIDNTSWSSTAAATRAVEEKEEERRMLHPTIAASLLTPSFLRDLYENGFTKLSGVIEADLIEAAFKEVNRQLGASSSTTDKFKVKTIAKESAVTALFNDSCLPDLMFKFFGGNKRYHQGAGQLALRFPGDACIGQTAKTNPAHFSAVASGWHIDGCANNFIPGVTDHFGQIRNFDCLVGVCLSATTREMSGELCVWPGSHRILADYFSRDDNLRRVQERGNSALPLKETKTLFRNLKPHHCLAQPGDVFLANYMTAHFIAPNSSPNIRYAVYFRVHGPDFDGRGGVAPESMLSPWSHWPCMRDQGEEETAQSSFRGGEEKVDITDEMLEVQASLDNFFLTPEIDGWACKACTYLHAGRELEMLACAVCGNVREN